MQKISPYEHHNGKIGVKVKFLISDRDPNPHSLCLIAYNALFKRIRSTSSKETQLRKPAKGFESLIEYDSLSIQWQSALIIAFGEPKTETKKSWFAKSYALDPKAQQFYKGYTFGEDLRSLSDEIISEYTINASVLNTVKFVKENRQHFRKSLSGTPGDIWTIISEEVNDFEEVAHTLPQNRDALRKKFTKYEKEGYKSIISLKLGTFNAKKITTEISDWLLAKYCLPIKMSVPALLADYKKVAIAKEWPTLTEANVNNWLQEPNVKTIWVAARHGKEEWRRLFGHTIKRSKENWFPNAYWALDGSKLDWIHFQDNTIGMAAKLKIDPLFDIFSEKIIGWSLSETEDHTDHFKAIKMAINNAGCRPYLFTYDNQGGHKMARMQTLYTELVAKEGGTHYAHRAYRHSSPVEGLFSRFQQQVLNQLWFSDKQSPMSRTANSKPNMDFIKTQKHNLKTKEDLIQAWEMCVKMWNEMPHPKFKDKTRNEVYQTEMPMSETVDMLEMISMFWISESDPITYNRGGLKITVAKQDYEFEVLNSDGTIDLDFRRNYIGAKLIVRYDPDYLNEMVQLYVDTPAGKTFVATAEKKRAHETVPVLMAEGARSALDKDLSVSDVEFEAVQKAYKDLMRRTGITPEQMIEDQELMMKMGGTLPKQQRSTVEANSSFSRL